ncbi:hypothetical protein [Sphingobacterium sp. UGAL515B_05]|uniref:hypothetical protein n=1 Tax=Sphingobacterium sp. UGAL515B_05 TaxID=2986767 RepID=UPI0029532F72|nr:hypothetical protein [Sphingobacterium sp. UGAL515B_05]WON93781.1 hypothetical protein OK025_21345 [Sphingobacterium sp. UGAL515B_05]
MKINCPKCCKIISKILGIVLFVVISFNANALKWHKKNIDSVLELSFPKKPIHFPLTEQGLERYICQQGGCYFSLSIRDSIIDDYYGYLLASDSTRESWANSTLNWVIDSKVNQPFHYLISKETLRLGYNDFGVDIVYATSDLTMAESNKRFAKLLLLGNSLYILDVWYMDDELHDLEKDKFFKSVSLKRK